MVVTSLSTEDSLYIHALLLSPRVSPRLQLHPSPNLSPRLRLHLSPSLHHHPSQNHRERAAAAAAAVTRVIPVTPAVDLAVTPAVDLAVTPAVDLASTDADRDASILRNTEVPEATQATPPHNHIAKETATAYNFP